ncbi:MAG: ATP-binding cassette domain-containing protein [Candidatus Latescibacteria bacterium]|nr:ATP-binding cassette domain-containing protein [Candidatus Latescibacterota bacterium]
MHFIRQFLDLIRPQRRLLAYSIGCGLLFVAANLLPPLVIRQLIQWLTEGGGSPAGLAQMAVLLLATYLLRGLVRYGYGLYSHRAAYQVMHRLMVRVYSHLQKLPHRFFHKRRTGDLIARSINDVEAVEDFIAHGIPETFIALVIPGAMLTVLFILDVKLALIALIPVPLAAFLVFRYVSRVRSMWAGVRGGLGDLIAQVQDYLSGIAVIKSFVQEARCARQIEQRSSTFRDRMIAANKISIIPAGLVEGAGGVGVVLVIWAGGNQALQGGLSVADLFVFVAYMAHIYEPFLRLASINDVLQKAASSTARIFDLLAQQSDIADAPGAKAPDRPTWSLRFADLTFGYDSGQPVLHQVDFEVEAGQVVALVGPTGAGKSTIASLVPRYYDPQQGQVQLGGYDLRQLPLDFLRRHIAAVPQDVFLFHGTIRENILFGQPDASQADMEAAAQAANAEEFIRHLPEGYDTLIGERGVRLSGGQKQRLSIARALLKNAPVLLLDEATSSVDTETEALIQEAIQRLIAHRTTLVIAHRLSTVRRADLILVLDQGHIIERGTHQELLAHKGLYTRMVQAQELAGVAV